MTGRNNRPYTKAIILSAGQGQRLLPLTADRPKCLLTVSGRSILERQLDSFMDAGIDEVVVVTGFRTDMVTGLLAGYADHSRIRTIFNPFYNVADNLASCWMARTEMNTDFLLLNGDTIFEQALLDKVLDSKSAPVTLTVDHKNTYDADDMKVQTEGEYVRHVSKSITADKVDAESIGLLYFREQGPRLFVNALDDAMRRPDGIKSWYLSVVDELASQRLVVPCPIDDLQWSEIDFIHDLTRAEAIFSVHDEDQGMADIPEKLVPEM